MLFPDDFANPGSMRPKLKRGDAAWCWRYSAMAAYSSVPTVRAMVCWGRMGTFYAQAVHGSSFRRGAATRRRTDAVSGGLRQGGLWARRRALRGVRALSGVLGHPPAQKCPEQAHIRLLRRVGGRGAVVGRAARLSRARLDVSSVSPQDPNARCSAASWWTAVSRG